MHKISKRQQAILDFIHDEVQAKGYPPSVREIGKAVNLASSSTVHGHLERLEKKGFIRRNPSKPRAIELLNLDRSKRSGDFSHSFVHVPVVSRVTASDPITATENIEKYFPLPIHMAEDDRRVFLLTVTDDSMIKVGILHGDYVIVRQQQTAKNNDIVVAITENHEATIRTFYRERNHVHLHPENPTYETIRLQDVTILGKVIGLFRDLHEYDNNRL